jgi:hypothetical protein
MRRIVADWVGWLSGNFANLDVNDNNDDDDEDDDNNDDAFDENENMQFLQNYDDDGNEIMDHNDYDDNYDDQQPPAP